MMRAAMSAQIPPEDPDPGVAETAYWNYRAVRSTHKCERTGDVEEFIQFHEVHYVTNGGEYDDLHITNFAVEPVTPYAEDVAEMKAVLARMNDALNKPLLKKSDLEALFRGP